MTSKQKRRLRKQQNPVVPVALGFALLATALIWLALSDHRARAENGQGDPSVAPLAVSFPAPELSLENIHGKIESLAKYKSGVVLVNNWATWCPPCKAEMPVLEVYYEDHAAQGFMIVAVEAGDAREDVEQFARSYGLTFQIWLDPHGAAVRAFGNGNLPNSYVIDRQGTVRYAWTGEVDRTTLEKYVTPLLTE